MNESKFYFGDFVPGKSHGGQDLMCLRWLHNGVEYGIGYEANLERTPSELEIVQYLTRRAMETTVMNVLAREAREPTEEK